MYEKFFRLKEKPFSSVADTSFLFKSSQYREAYNHLLYGIRAREGFMLITGEAGTGKTTLCRALLQRLGGHIETALVLNPPATPVELLQTILQDLGCANPDIAGKNRKALLDTLNDHLTQCASSGRPVVVMIDEAQDLSMEILAEIRRLSNFETDKTKLIQIILAGQPALLDKLVHPALKQLYQRIAIHYALKPLGENELASYIRFRMLKAGSRGSVGFTRQAVKRIYQYSGGVPRTVNQICDKGLLAGYVARRYRITGSMVQEAVQSVYNTEPLPARRRWQGVAGAAALVLVFGVAFLMSGGGEQPSQKLPDSEQIRHVQPLAKAPAVSPVYDSAPVRDLDGLEAEPGGSGLSEVQNKATEVLQALPSGGEVFLPGVGPDEAFALTRRNDDPFHEGFDGDGVYRSAESTQCAREALATVLNLWGLPREVLTDAFERWGRQGPRFSLYDNAQELGLRVLAVKRGRLEQIAAMDYPCIVPVEDDRTRFVVLSGFRDREIILLDPRNGRRSVSREHFKKIWTGRVFYVWKDFDGLPAGLKRGDVHDDVVVLKGRLEELGFGISDPFSEVFNYELEQHVKRLQTQFKLKADGILGNRTLMVIYRALFGVRLPALKGFDSEDLMVTQPSGYNYHTGVSGRGRL